MVLRFCYTAKLNISGEEIINNILTHNFLASLPAISKILGQGEEWKLQRKGEKYRSSEKAKAIA